MSKLYAVCVGIVAVWVLCMILIGMGKLYAIILANHELTHAVVQHCYSTVIGETATLIMVDGDIVCKKFFHGTMSGV